ncbi:MAG: beta-N-acetylhexosaminidase, partial [Peptostreptococcaceae bacterium]
MKKIKRLIFIVIALVLGTVGCANTKQDKKIQEAIENMALEEKIGQMILAGFDGTEVSESLVKLVQEQKIGGIILFKRNIESSTQLKSLTKEIKTLNEKIPLFISVDEEGGRVSRLSEDIEKFPSAQMIGEKNSKEYAYENGKKLGEVLSEHGINMNHAPVLDIYSNPKNTVIGDRAFGTDEEIVSTMGIETMKGLEESNVIPTVKHFPGHGDTEVDSHVGLPIVYKTLEELKKFELVPFEKAINEGCDVVMVSHILLENIDSKNPASLSKIVISDILREDLGFDNVVMTDDMNMSAITKNMDVEKACVESIKAGSDILLIGSGEYTVN